MGEWRRASHQRFALRDLVQFRGFTAADRKCVDTLFHLFEVGALIAVAAVICFKKIAVGVKSDLVVDSRILTVI